MRERSTWNRNEIARTASVGKRAEDPRAMNQDHLQQQPKADAYTIGGPSEFGEDVHPSTGTWKAEYSGDSVARNEIGMPEMRKDTFNHPEKTAAMDKEAALKKADLATTVARKMLPKNATDEVIEEQAFALMQMPDRALIDTANRLAAAQDDEEEEQGQGQQKQANDDEEEQGQSQQKQAQGQQQSKQSEQDEKKGQEQDEKQQSKQAGQIPPQFLENVKKKKDEAEDKKDDAKDDKKEASVGNAFIAAMKAGNGQGVEQALASMLNQAFQQMAQGQQQTQQQQMAQGQQTQQQMAQQQAQQQAQLAQQQAQQAQQQMAQGQQMSDDQMLDQMLQDQMGQPQQVMAAGTVDAGEIQLEANTMDVGEVSLEAQDDVLSTLFASNNEYQQAAEAHALLNGGARPMTASQPMTRTAATRTVGTRPTAGVSQLGGAVGGSQPASEVDKLSGLWASAPDVSNVFRS